MPSLKYPSGLKVKASLAWIGAFACGFIPIFYYFPTLSYTYCKNAFFLDFDLFRI